MAVAVCIVYKQLHFCLKTWQLIKIRSCICKHSFLISVFMREECFGACSKQIDVFCMRYLWGFYKDASWGTFLRSDLKGSKLKKKKKITKAVYKKKIVQVLGLQRKDQQIISKWSCRRKTCVLLVSLAERK